MCIAMESERWKLIWNFFGKNFVELFVDFLLNRTTKLNRFSLLFYRHGATKVHRFLRPFSVFHSLILSLNFSLHDDYHHEQQRFSILCQQQISTWLISSAPDSFSWLWITWGDFCCLSFSISHMLIRSLVCWKQLQWWVAVKVRCVCLIFLRFELKVWVWAACPLILRSAQYSVLTDSLWSRRGSSSRVDILNSSAGGLSADDKIVSAGKNSIWCNVCVLLHMHLHLWLWRSGWRHAEGQHHAPAARAAKRAGSGEAAHSSRLNAPAASRARIESDGGAGGGARMALSLSVHGSHSRAREAALVSF
jgi:hypothetical protein